MGFTFTNIGEYADKMMLRYWVESDANKPLGLDMSIESMDTQGFSEGIFYFLIFAILLFVGISFMFMFKDRGKSSKLKKGEKLLFAWIMFGVVVAIVFGAAQMMHGFLF